MISCHLPLKCYKKSWGIFKSAWVLLATRCIGFQVLRRRRMRCRRFGCRRLLAAGLWLLALASDLWLLISGQRRPGFQIRDRSLKFWTQRPTAGNQKQEVMALALVDNQATDSIYRSEIDAVYRRIAINQRARLMFSTKKRPIKACGFDLGNTLINDTQLAKCATVEMADWLFSKSHIQSRQAFLTTFESVNHGSEKPFISHTFGEIEFFEETFEKLTINAISAEEALQKYREILMQKIQPDKDIVDALQLLKEKNMRIALLSNESVERVDAYLKKTNLRHFFDTIVVSAGIGVEKPDLRFFQEALNRLNIKGQEMALFGDNQIADGAAKKLGVFFILVTGYMNKNWIWEKGNPYLPDYTMEKITRKAMEAFLNTSLLDR